MRYKIVAECDNLHQLLQTSRTKERSVNLRSPAIFHIELELFLSGRPRSSRKKNCSICIQTLDLWGWHLDCYEISALDHSTTTARHKNHKYLVNIEQGNLYTRVRLPLVHPSSNCRIGCWCNRIFFAISKQASWLRTVHAVYSFPCIEWPFFYLEFGMQKTLILRLLPLK